MKYQRFLLSLLAQLVFLYTNGQETRKNLTPDVYTKWEKLGMIRYSNDANHLMYMVSNGENSTKYVLMSLQKGTKRTFTNVRNAQFLSYKNYFSYITKGDSLFVESIEGKPIYRQSQVASLQSLADGRFVLLSDQLLSVSDPKNLQIVDLATKNRLDFSEVKIVSISPDLKKVLFYGHPGVKNQFTIFNLHSATLKSIEIASGFEPSNIRWTEDSQSLSFSLQNDEDTQILRYIGLVTDVDHQKQVKMIDMKSVLGWEGLTISRYGTNSMELSKDKRNVFIFTNYVFEEKAPDKGVEVWKSRAKWLFPYQKIGDYKLRPKLGVLDIENHSYKIITKDHEELSIKSKQDRYIINLDKSKYQPAYKLGGEHFDMRMVDLDRKDEYILDTIVKDHGTRILFAESIGGLLYYNKNHWHLHNLNTKKTTRITSEIPNLVSECVNCKEGLALGKSGREFYVFDQFDLWQVDVAGHKPKKLTGQQGSEIEFRFAQNYYSTNQRHQILEVDPDQGILLQAFNRRTGDTGFFKWTYTKGLEEIVYGPMKFQYEQVLPHNKGFLYTRETFDRSPEIIWQPSVKEKGKVVARSNIQQDEYFWAKSEMVHYRSPRNSRSDGHALNGALFYPANYDPSKKYPLIVSIYEDNSYTLHEYLNPGVNIFVDFNPTDYTQEGYFVLQPNLKPRDISNPNHSMMVNLQAAVDYMKSTGMIDEKRIGLYGHSFGGFESLFAASQSEDFATVIAGAAISDIKTDYFAHRQLLRGPSFYRTEQMQKEMKRNYFEIPELYEANSPFTYIPKIKIPILLWTGKNDVNVGPEQSVQFYLGMLRLDKDCTMLMYPDEDHVLAKKENIEDLDRRMKQWFGHYLKGGPKEPWMKSDE